MRKDFLYFNRSERTGAMVLAVLIAVLLLIRFVVLPSMDEKEAGEPIPAQYRKQIEDFTEQVNKSQAVAPLRLFSPWRLTREKMISMGISEQDADSLMAIKKGITTKPKDSSFTVVFEQFASTRYPELLPFIRHPRQKTSETQDSIHIN